MVDLKNSFFILLPILLFVTETFLLGMIYVHNESHESLFIGMIFWLPIIVSAILCAACGAYLLRNYLTNQSLGQLILGTFLLFPLFLFVSGFVAKIADISYPGFGFLIIPLMGGWFMVAFIARLFFVLTTSRFRNSTIKPSGIFSPDFFYFVFVIIASFAILFILEGKGVWS